MRAAPIKIMYSFFSTKLCAKKKKLSITAPDKKKAGTMNFLCFLKPTVTVRIAFDIANIISKVSATGVLRNERKDIKGTVANKTGSNKQCNKHIADKDIPILSNFSFFILILIE